LVSCAPETVGEVMQVFQRHGFAQAADIGEVIAAGPEGSRLIVA